MARNKAPVPPAATNGGNGEDAEPGTPKKTGRPTKYTPDMARLARGVCLLGAKNVELAAFLQISTSTLDAWMNEHPEFKQAVKEGREEADNKVARSLYKRALGYKHKAVKIMQHMGAPVVVDYVEHYPPDPASMIFWLKNRRPDLWREKVDVEHSGNVSIKETLKQRRERARAGRS